MLEGILAGISIMVMVIAVILALSEIKARKFRKLIPTIQDWETLRNYMVALDENIQEHNEAVKKLIELQAGVPSNGHKETKVKEVTFEDAFNQIAREIPPESIANPGEDTGKPGEIPAAVATRKEWSPEAKKAFGEKMAVARAKKMAAQNVEAEKAAKDNEDKAVA